MTKRSLERTVEAVSDEMLTALKPMERLHYVLKAQARNKERWLDRLHETCPPEQARTFAACKRLALLSALEAVYDLHTTALHFELLETEQQRLISINYYRDEKPSNERLERAADRASDMRALFATLYIAYHSYRRFAQEQLDLDLETWFTLHKDGVLVVAFVKELLDNSTQQTLAAKWLAEDAETTSDDPDAEILDTHVDRQYQTLVAMWDDFLAASGPRSRR